MVTSEELQIPRIADIFCLMENLETLDLLGCKLTLEQLPRVFSSCPKLVELYFTTFKRQLGNG